MYPPFHRAPERTPEPWNKRRQRKRDRLRFATKSAGGAKKLLPGVERSAISANLICYDIFRPAFSFSARTPTDRQRFRSNGLRHKKGEAGVQQPVGAGVARRRTHASGWASGAVWSSYPRCNEYPQAKWIKSVRRQFSSDLSCRKPLIASVRRASNRQFEGKKVFNNSQSSPTGFSSLMPFTAITNTQCLQQNKLALMAPWST